jgi:tetratricopeptide (TPR) repeat protein
MHKVISPKLLISEPLAPETFEEVYGLMLRALRRKVGFGLFFAEQTDISERKTMIERIRQDLSHKKVAELSLSRETQKLYNTVAELYEQESFDLLIIEGLERAFYEYEDTKRRSGWTTEEIYSYISWRGVPPILDHLNQQRERFAANFPCHFLFFLPGWALKYVIQRAPDFFDWRSGLFRFPLSSEELELRSKNLLSEDFEQCLEMSPTERLEKLLEIKDLILATENDPKMTSNLLNRQAMLFWVDQEFDKAIVALDKAIQIDSKNSNLWNNRGINLLSLKRYEEALSNFERSLEYQSGNIAAWKNKSNLLMLLLNRYEEALESWDHVIQVNSKDSDAWINKAFSLNNLERYEEALEISDRAINLNPNNYRAWSNKAAALVGLQRYEEALEISDGVINLNPNDYHTWVTKAAALIGLQRYEEALESSDKAIALNSHGYQVWLNKAVILKNRERYEEALESCK